jgi:hypothetical protein
MWAVQGAVDWYTHGETISVEGRRMFRSRSANGKFIYVMPKLDTLAYNRIVLIISPFNTVLTEDPYGSYRVILDPTG